MAKKKRSNKTTKAIIITVIVLILIAAITVTVIYFAAPEVFASLIEAIKGGQGGDGVLMVTVIDVGQGDCIYIEFPDGQNMLMDAGTELGTSSYYSDITAVLGAKNINALDYVFITHSDYDHIRYMPDIFEQYEVRNVYIPRVADDMSATWTKTVTAARNEKYANESGESVPAQIVYNIGSYEITGKDWKMRCYSYDEEDYPDVKKSSGAEKKNSVSPICFLEYSGRTIVLTGDSNELNEEYLEGKGVLETDADVLKVGHHGSATSTMDYFLDSVDCEYAVISYGEGNEYGHPTQAAVNRITNYRDEVVDGDYNGYQYIYYTAVDGNVSISVNGSGTLDIDCETTDYKDIELVWTQDESTSAVMQAVGHMYICACGKDDEVQVAA